MLYAKSQFKRIMMCTRLVFLTSFVLLLTASGLSGTAHAGTVTGTLQTAETNTDWAETAQDITAMATDGDWRLWEATVGDPAYEKDTPIDLIGDLFQVGTWSVMSENWIDQNFAWSDGVNPQNTLETPVGVGSSEGIPVNAGYQFNVTLPSGLSNIAIWAGTCFAQGTLTILDGSVELFSIKGNNNGQSWGIDRFDLAFSDFSSDTVLTITWIATSATSSARAIFYGVAVAAENSIQLQRQMENLSRGMVAVNLGGGRSSDVYIGWRLLGTDSNDIAFNLYRSTSEADPIKLNDLPIIQSTNYIDHNVNLDQSHSYFVKPVIDSNELEASTEFILHADSPVQQYISIPLLTPPGYTPNDNPHRDHRLCYRLRPPFRPQSYRRSLPCRHHRGHKP